MAPWWCWIMNVRNRRSNSAPRAASSWASCGGVSMPGISSMPGIMKWAGSPSGTVSLRPRSQRCIRPISSVCPTTMRSHRACSAGLAPCDGAQRAMSTACAWWPIMPVMKCTSAAVYTCVDAGAGGPVPEEDRGAAVAHAVVASATRSRTRILTFRSMTNSEKPCCNHGPPRTAGARRRWRRARREWTELRLEEIRYVPHGVHRDGLGAPHRGDRRDHGVLVRGVLAHHGDVTVAPGGDIDQALRGVPAQGIDAVAVGNRGDHLATRGVDHDGGLAATGEDPVRGAVVGDAGRALARRQRPRRQHAHRFHIQYLNRALAFVVDVDLPSPIARRSLRPVVLQLGGADDVAGPGVERDGGADGTAVIREDDAVGEIVVHDAVEPAGGDLDLLDHRQGLEVEHRDRGVAGAGNEAVVR